MLPQVQEEMINEIWSDETLALTACKRVHGPANEVLFLGPRVKMGIYEGKPNRICPHTTTGRADYFGPFVNRQAPCRPALHSRFHSCQCHAYAVNSKKSQRLMSDLVRYLA